MSSSYSYCVLLILFLTTAPLVVNCFHVSERGEVSNEHNDHTSTMSPIATDGTSRPHHQELPSGHVENSPDASLMEPIAPEHLTTDALMAMANAAAATLPRHPPPPSSQESPHGEERSDATFPSFAGQLTSLLTSASSPLSRLRSPFIMSLPDTFLSDFSAPSPFHAPHPNDMEIMPLHKCKYCSGHNEMFNAPFQSPRAKYQSARPSYIPPSPVQAARPYFQPRPLLMMPYSSKTNMGNIMVNEGKGGNGYHQQQQQQQQQMNNVNFPTKGQPGGGRYTPLPRPGQGVKYPPPPPPAAYGGKGPSGGGGRQLLNLKDSSRIVVLVLHLDKSDQGSSYQASRPIGPIKGPSKGPIVQMQEPVQKARQVYEEQRKEPMQQQIIYGHGQIKQATSPTITNNVYFDPERIQLPYSSATLVPSPTHESTAPSSSSSSQDAPSSSSSNTNTNHQPSDSSNSNMLRTTVTSSSSSATFTPSPREEDSTAFKPMTLLGHRMRSSPSASASAAVASSDVISHSMDDVQRKMEDYASPVPLSSSLLPSLLPASFSSKVPVSSMSLSFKSAISSLQPSSQAVTSRRAPQRS